MFGSDHDGERAAAAALADALVREHGLRWADVIMPASAPTQSPDWRLAVRFCVAQQHELSPRELDFIVTLARWRGEPTSKQQKWLNDIVSRLREY